MSNLQEFFLYFIELLEKNPKTSIIPHILNTVITHSQKNIENGWKPNIDIIEEKNFIIIYVDIPGVIPSSIDIDFFNNKITISGERIKMYNTDNVLKKEINYGKFYKEIILPLSITKRESVNVNNSFGVLTININKILEGENKFKINL